jgi:hypothetical protein
MAGKATPGKPGATKTPSSMKMSLREINSAHSPIVLDRQSNDLLSSLEATFTLVIHPGGQTIRTITCKDGVNIPLSEFSRMAEAGKFIRASVKDSGSVDSANEIRKVITHLLEKLTAAELRGIDQLGDEILSVLQAEVKDLNTISKVRKHFDSFGETSPESILIAKYCDVMSSACVEVMLLRLRQQSTKGVRAETLRRTGLLMSVVTKLMNTPVDQLPKSSADFFFPADHGKGHTITIAEFRSGITRTCNECILTSTLEINSWADIDDRIEAVMNLMGASHAIDDSVLLAKLRIVPPFKDTEHFFRQRLKKGNATWLRYATEDARGIIEAYSLACLRIVCFGPANVPVVHMAEYLDRQFGEEVGAAAKLASTRESAVMDSYKLSTRVPAVQAGVRSAKGVRRVHTLATRDMSGVPNPDRVFPLEEPVAPSKNRVEPPTYVTVRHVAVLPVAPQVDLAARLTSNPAEIMKLKFATNVDSLLKPKAEASGSSRRPSYANSVVPTPLRRMVSDALGKNAELALAIIEWLAGFTKPRIRERAAEYVVAGIAMGNYDELETEEVPEEGAT